MAIDMNSLNNRKSIVVMGSTSPGATPLNCKVNNDSSITILTGSWVVAVCSACSSGSDTVAHLRKNGSNLCNNRNGGSWATRVMTCAVWCNANDTIDVNWGGGTTGSRMLTVIGM